MTSETSQPGSGDHGRSDDGARSGARIRQAGREAASTARSKVRAELEKGKRSAATTAGDATAALDHTAETLATQGHETLAEAASSMSAKLASLAGYVETRSLDELMNDTRRLARQNPGLLIAGGVALGLALSRFFKASPGRSEAMPASGSSHEPQARRAREENSSGRQH